MLLLNVPGPRPDQNPLAMTEIEVRHQLSINYPYWSLYTSYKVKSGRFLQLFDFSPKWLCTVLASSEILRYTRKLVLSRWPLNFTAVKVCSEAVPKTRACYPSSTDEKLYSYEISAKYLWNQWNRILSWDNLGLVISSESLVTRIPCIWPFTDILRGQLISTVIF